MTEETPEVTKCTANPNGYGASFCQGMASTLDFNPTKQSKGMFGQSMSNIKTGAELGTRVVIITRTRPKGMVVNLCPFCGGPLRDISND